MFKLFKRFLQFLSVLVIIIVVGMIGIVLFVNPNQFKGAIEQQVLAETGHVLSIQGPITWQWSPLLSLGLENVVLNNAAPFKNKLLSAKAVRAGLGLGSLFSGKIFVSLKLEGFDLALEKNAKGQTNLENFIAQVSKTKNPQTQSVESTHNKNDKTMGPILPSAIEIVDGRFTFYDSAKNQTHTIEHINLSVNNILKGLLGFETPIALSLETDSFGKITLKSDWSLKFSEDELILRNIALTLTIPGGKTTTLKGEANVQSLTHPKTLLVYGDFSSKELQWGKFKIDDLKGKIDSKAGLIRINPMSFQLASSLQKLSVQIDLRDKTPKFSLTQEAQNFDIKPVLALLDVKDKLEGKTNLKVKLTTSGAGIEQWRQNLSGNTEIEIKQGKFYGVDLIHILKNAQMGLYNLVGSLTKKADFNLSSALTTGLSSVQGVWDQNANDAVASTPFDSMKATTTITNGVVKNPDLNIYHSDYAITGQGNVNLVNEAIHYQTSVLLKKHGFSENDAFGNYLAKTPLLVKIGGTLKNPYVYPDFKTYTHNAISFAQKEIVQKVVEKTVQNTVQKTVEKAIGQTLDQHIDVEGALGGLLDTVKGN